MSNVESKKINQWDKYIGYIATLLGILSTGLGLFIAITTISINQRVNELQATNLKLDERLKNLDLVSKQNELINSKFSNSVRIEAEFRIFNANAFASNYKEKSMRIVWIDAPIQSDIEKWLGDWINGNKLMTGASKDGLFARQVVCLRIINAGNTPARKIKLVVKQASFDNGKGEFRKPYYAVDTEELIWQNKVIEIGDLAEPSQRELLKTQMLIPIAHISGGNRYFGQVIIPLELTWLDERQNKTEKMSINVKSDTTLKSDLESSILGISNF
jgi:hypothetical protein